MPLISIVVPCYNEAESLPVFWRTLTEAFQALAREGVAMEAIFVDDGSRDETVGILRGLRLTDARVKLLVLSRNFGKEAAMLAGLRAAGGDYVAVMDADLQDPPALLPRMYALLLESGCDCVATLRENRAGEPPVRSAFAHVFYRLVNAFSPIRLEDGVRDFRLMRREMLETILRLSEKRRFSKGLFAWVGFDVREIPYANVERIAGQSKWSFWALLRYAVEGVFSLTYAPLLLPWALLCILASLALVLLCCGDSAAALLCGLGALTQAALGVVAAYCARILSEARKRPHYLFKGNPPHSGAV